MAWLIYGLDWSCIVQPVSRKERVRASWGPVRSSAPFTRKHRSKPIGYRVHFLGMIYVFGRGVACSFASWACVLAMPSCAFVPHLLTFVPVSAITSLCLEMNDMAVIGRL